MSCKIESIDGSQREGKRSPRSRCKSLVGYLSEDWLIVLL